MGRDDAKPVARGNKLPMDLSKEMHKNKSIHNLIFLNVVTGTKSALQTAQESLSARASWPSASKLLSPALADAADNTTRPRCLRHLLLG